MSAAAGADLFSFVRPVIVAVVALAAGAAARPVCADEGDFFEAKIRPVLAGSCFKCHGGEKVSGKLRVDGREALIKGGESGPAVVPGEPGKSLLLAAISRVDEDTAMPPDKKKALPAAVVKDFETWIKGGATWPAKAAALTGGKHWAFEPVKKAAPPKVEGAAHWIDAFILQRLSQAKIAPAGRADARTLIRRATFDLTGLPPTPEEVEAFVAEYEKESSKFQVPGSQLEGALGEESSKFQDPSSKSKDNAADNRPEQTWNLEHGTWNSAAYARLIDRLLASPRYGERWGRHWLDVVRYADTAGETADFPVPHAWRYRNYVINAFNSDKPYDQFLREQLAGDILASREADVSSERYAELVTATGYIAIARRFGFDIEKDHFLTIDDTIDTLGKSVLGLAIGCARCHDHKYDPITAADYYALYGIFDSTRYPFTGCEKTPRSRDMMALMPAKEIERLVKPVKEQLAALDAEIKRLNEQQAGTIAKLGEEAAKATSVLARGEIGEGGSQAFSFEETAGLKGASVKAGQMIRLVIGPRGNHGGDSTKIEWQITEEGGGKRAWNVREEVVSDLLAGNPHADRLGGAATWWFIDARKGPMLLPEPLRDFSGAKGLNIWRRGDTPSVFVNASEKPVKVWTELPAKTFFAHPAPDGPVAVGWVSPADMVVNISGSVADAHPNNGDGVSWSIELVGGDWPGALAKMRGAAEAITKLTQERTAVAAREPKPPVAFAVTEGKPHHVPIFIRGDPESRGEVVPRRFLSLFGGQLVPEGAGSGRLELANWLASESNPLTARVMVNRIWHYHFGAGLVRTTSDFGLRGAPPSHPELLDWLAARFVEEKWSIKAMHRLIMTSEAYQRKDRHGVTEARRHEGKEADVLAIGGEKAGDAVASKPSDPQTQSLIPDSQSLAAELDPSNTLLWRFDRRRLSAEEIRDSILFVSGDLDPAPGEAHAFPAENSWGFTQHNPFSAVYDHNRRSVYLMTQRLKRHPYLTLFDGPDASATTSERHSSTMPTQALFFLNDPFVHAKANSLATRLLALGDDAARVDRAFRLMYGRAPSEKEAKSAVRFVAEYSADLKDVPDTDRARTAWSAWLRVMFGSNEFLYVD